MDVFGSGYAMRYPLPANAGFISLCYLIFIMCDYIITNQPQLWYELDDYQNDPGIDAHNECARIHVIDGIKYVEFEYSDPDYNTYELYPITHGPRPCN